MRVKIKHSGMQLSRSRTISMRHISYMMGKKEGRLDWWLHRWQCTLFMLFYNINKYWHIILHVNHFNRFMLFYNTVYFFPPGVSMWFYFRVPWKDPTVHSTCWYGMMARWAIQNMSRHLPSRKNAISGWLCRKLHPTTTKWNTKSRLLLREGDHNGPY